MLFHCHQCSIVTKQVGHMCRSSYIAMWWWNSFLYRLNGMYSIQSESSKQSKGDINISVLVIGNVCYGDGKVSGIRLHMFLIIAFSSTYCIWHNLCWIFVNTIYTKIMCRVGLNGWMNDLWFNVPFNSISFISRRWKAEHKKLCAMKRRLGSEINSPPMGLEPETPRSEAGSANRAATGSLLQ